jgi:hypothetical protein
VYPSTQKVLHAMYVIPVNGCVVRTNVIREVGLPGRYFDLFNRHLNRKKLRELVFEGSVSRTSGVRMIESILSSKVRTPVGIKDLSSKFGFLA